MPIERGLSSVLALSAIALAGCTGAGGEPRMAEAQVPPGRGALLLNGVWEFAAAPDGKAPAAGWKKLRVPHRSREYEKAPPASGWYRTAFRVPRDWDAAGSDVVLDLSRVRHYGRVHVDGRVVGEHWGMRTPFVVPLSGKVVAGKSYPLVLYTHNCTGTYAHASGRRLSKAAERALNTMHRGTAFAVGVEGDVWLRLVPRLRIGDVYVIPSVRRKTITVEVTVRNATAAAVPVEIDLAVTRRGKVERRLPKLTAEIAPGESRTLRASAPWRNPILWGRPPYGKAVLYFLRSSLRREGAAALSDARVTRFGFREVWSEGEKLLLNGKPLFLVGDHCLPYVYERQWLLRKLSELARANCSVVEAHRHDPPGIVYEVADELGVFHVGANFCGGAGMAPGGLPPDEFKLVLENYLKVTEHWIRRARNHPSLLVWYPTCGWDAKYYVPLARRIHSLDRTRILEITAPIFPGASYTHAPFDKAVADIIGGYRFFLFGGTEDFAKAVAAVRADPRFPPRPLRIGEAGYFSKYEWPPEKPPPVQKGREELVRSLPARGVCGFSTFCLVDMDTLRGQLFHPIEPKVTWPAQSGRDARIDPFGENAPAARSKPVGLFVNWSDPGLPVCRTTPTYDYWRALARKVLGRDVGPLAKTRVPEVLVTVLRDGRPAPGANVFVRPLAGQGLQPYGVMADPDGRSWFVLPEEGRYEFSCRVGGARQSVVVDAKRHRVDAGPGYGHIQRARIGK